MPAIEPMVMTWPSPRRDQLRQQRPGHPHHAEHVGVVHPAPLLLVGLGDGSQPERAAGVVHEQRGTPATSAQNALDRRRCR